MEDQIWLYFTADPKRADVEKVDVVIVELKKRQAGAKAITDLIDELVRRLNLLENNCKKLNRAWHFGIEDIPNEIIGNLRSKGFNPLFSKEKCFYSSIPLFALNNNYSSTPSYFCDAYLLDYDAVINDAESRMLVFKSILINAFKKASDFHFT